jgi:chromate transporter
MKNLFEIFYHFLFLGLVSFGGPMAHIGYFRKTFVEKLKWLDEVTYSKFIALSQFLPGPSSSQVGFSIGLKKGGLLGGILAFIAFTFPSFLILYILATFNIVQSDNSIINGVIAGLKLFAVVIVADVALSMFKSFCKDKISIVIFILATLILLLFSSILTQIFILLCGALIGNIFIKNKSNNEQVKTKKIKLFPFLIFLILLFSLPILSSYSESVKLFSSFYEAGSLVFGGGHVVLPLLEQSLGDAISNESFLVGYSLAQAVPGPMFTIASYLGANIFETSPFLGALIATIAIFLPGFLLVLSFGDSFESYTKKPKILNAIAGVNAAVVALIVAVLINTIIPSSIHSFIDCIIVLTGLYIFRKFKVNVLYMIILFILGGMLLMG